MTSWATDSAGRGQWHGPTSPHFSPHAVARGVSGTLPSQRRLRHNWLAVTRGDQERNRGEVGAADSRNVRCAPTSDRESAFSPATASVFSSPPSCWAPPRNASTMIAPTTHAASRINSNVTLNTSAVSNSVNHQSRPLTLPRTPLEDWTEQPPRSHWVCQELSCVREAAARSPEGDPKRAHARNAG